MGASLVKFVETKNEYQLFVPYEDRDRAKKIYGYRWNPGKKFWSYPKTETVYQSIIEEFGDTIQTIPKSAQSPEPINLRQNDGEMQKELEKLKIELEKVTLAKENLYKKSHEQVAELIKEERRLQNMNANLRIELTKHQAKGSEVPLIVEAYLKDKVIHCAAKSPQIAHALSKGPMSVDSVLLLYANLEARFRKLLNSKTSDLFSLIEMANDAKLIKRPVFSLLHQFRNLRNLLSHDPEITIDREAVVLSALFVASLLWPNLPEKDEEKQ